MVVVVELVVVLEVVDDELVDDELVVVLEVVDDELVVLEVVGGIVLISHHPSRLC